MLIDLSLNLKRYLGGLLVALLLAIPGMVRAGEHGPPVGPVIPVADFITNPIFGVEGIAMSPENDLYVGSQFEGLIYRVRQSGQTEVFASFGFLPYEAFVVGLVVADDYTLYAAVASCSNGALNGVWHIDRFGNRMLAMHMPSNQCFESDPNALSFDEKGNLYVTDSVQGTVWRLGRDGTGGLWVKDNLLLAPGGFGANGISYRDNSLWVLVTDRGAIIEIPILSDGSAGKPRVFVQSDLLVGIDGGQFDVAGNMYVGNVYSQTLLRVSKKGEVATLVTQAQFNGYYWPTNPVFGFEREKSTIYISGANPSVVKVDVGIPGMLMPQFKHGDRNHLGND